MADEKFPIDDLPMSELLKGVPEHVHSGTIVSARVLGTNPDGVLVDIGLKMEGLIPRSEFDHFDTSLPFKTGDTISVLVRYVEGQERLSRVSWQAARQWSAWDRLASAFREQTAVEGTVRRKVKGGYVMDIGVDAFLPGSQVDLRPSHDVSAWLDKTFQVLVTEMDRAKSNVVVSRRKLLEREQHRQREVTLANLAEGDVKTGTVTGIVRFGAFVDIGGIEGLLHVSDISWQRQDHAEPPLKVGQTLQVKVLKHDPATHRISLGLKQLTPHPWIGVPERYPAGSLVKGRVSALTSFGAFVEMEPGVEGLLHNSEISWKERINRPGEVLRNGQEVTVKVLQVDPAKQKLSLSLKRVEPSPWEQFKSKYPPGSRLKGTITHLAPFGAFVKLPSGIEGLVHVSDLSWAQRPKHPSEIVSTGQEIETVVLEVRPDAEKIVLSLKHTQEDPLAALHKGQVVAGTVVNVQDSGVIVKLPSGVEGLVRRTELGEDAEGAAQIPETNQCVTAKILWVDPKERTLELSIRRYDKEEERRMIARYAGQNQDPLTLGDILVESDAPDESQPQR